MPITAREFRTHVYEQLARVGKALSSPVRLEILNLLSQGPKTVEQLAKEANQSVANTSQHLQGLRSAGLISSERDGNYVVYQVATTEVAVFLSEFHAMGASRLAEIQQITQQFLSERQSLDRLDHEELVKRVRRGEVILLDVRPASEYESAHLPSAISVPLEELERHLQELPKDKEIVAYCRGPLCVMAIEAVNRLRGLGYKAVRLEDGVGEWMARGMPVIGGMRP
jgi:rhodanese-related sulfurtransferase/predicted transcriptional regulator